MDEKDFNIAIAHNITYYLSMHEMSQIDLAKYVGVSTASVSNWCKGIKVPRMDKIDLMCKRFGITRSELIEKDGPALRQSRIEKEEILNIYDTLSSEGKRKVVEYAEDLSKNPKYSI